MAAAAAKWSEGNLEDKKEVIAKYRAQIDAVKAKLTSKWDDDVMMYRFLRVYKFNVDDAAKHANDTLKWRADLKMDEVREKAVKAYREGGQAKFPFADAWAFCMPHNLSHKCDKLERPLRIDWSGKSKPESLVKIKLDDLLQYCYYEWEYTYHHLAAETERTGKIMREVQILDMAGLGMQHFHMHSIGYIQKMMELYQTHYPDFIGSIMVVNAPSMFEAFWKLVKAFLAEDVQKSVKVLADTKDLSTYVDADKLPTFYGGTCKCEGGCVRVLNPEEGYTKTTVASGGKHEVKKDVAAGDVVAWNFATRGNDIGFRVEFTAAGKPAAVVHPSTHVAGKVDRVDSHKKVQDGQYEAKEAGVVNVIFDNTYSSWTSKNLIWKVDHHKAATMAAAIGAAEKKQ